MNVKTWDRIEAINGVDASKILQSRPELQNGDIILILDNGGRVTNIEFPETLCKIMQIDGEDLSPIEIGERYIEFLDTHDTPEPEEGNRIEQLESALLEMTTLNAMQQAQNEQAIMELTMMIGGI